MKRLSVFCVSLFVAVVMFSSCTDQVSSVEDNPVGPVGEVKLVVKLGKVGGSTRSAIKVAMITLDSLVMNFTASGESPIHVNIPISGGADQQTVSEEVELPANKTWNLSIKSYDGIRSWDNVHSKDTSFYVVEGTNPAISIALDARYTMLVVHINSVPDSSTYMGLFEGNNINMMWTPWDDTTYAKGPKSPTDTVKLNYDWLQVMPMSRHIQVVIRGDWNGAHNVDLYWGTFNIPSVIAGQDANYSFNLNWIGPSSTTGQTPINTILGRFGIITVNGTPVK